MKTITKDILRDIYDPTAPVQVHRAGDMIYGIAKRKAMAEGIKMSGIKSLKIEIEVYDED